jgi:peptidoglycan/LPS O-acetylase OafA/YrhL
VEIFCYLLFPAFALVFCRIGSRAVILACGLLFFAALLLIAFLAPRHLAQIQLAFGTNMPPDRLAMWITYYSPMTRICEFCIGCAAACYLTSGERIATGSRLPIAAGLLALSGAILVFMNRSTFANLAAVDLAIRAGLAAGSALLVYGMPSRPDHLISRILATRPARIGGEISYSTYLLHPFALGLLVHRVWARSNPLAVCELVLTMIVAMAGIYLVSYVTYRVIEVPARRWIRSNLRGRAPQPLRTLGTAAPG